MNQPNTITLALFLTLSSSYAQDLENEYHTIKQNIKQNPVSVSGSIGASSVFYQSFNIAPRRDPFYWVVTANLNIKVLDKIDIPFSAIITQQDKNFVNGLDKFSQPFNQFGISPKYKWLTIHAGYRSVEMSQYSLAGAIFLGGGVEIKPEKSFVKVTGIVGRFVKAVPKGGLAGVVVSIPAYERFGYAAKIRTGKENNYCDFIFLNLSDRISTIPFDTILTSTPQQNQIFSFATKQKLNKIFSIQGEWAYSQFTGNLYQPPIKKEYSNGSDKLFNVRPSTSFNSAGNIALDLTLRKAVVGITYKRIDPDYKSLGSVFLTNDVEEAAANTRFTLLKNKLNINLSGGVQRNNLDKVQQQTSRRLITSVDLNFNPLPSIQFGLNFSNFSSNTIPVRNVFSDSIQLLQITQSAAFHCNYSLAGRKNQFGLVFQALQQTSNINHETGSQLLSLNFAPSCTFKKIKLNVQLGLTYNQSRSTNVETTGFGPTAGMQKTLAKNKLKIGYNFSTQLINSKNNKISNSSVHGINLNMKISERQSLRMDASLLSKQALQAGVVSFYEWRGTIGYQLTFSASKKKIST